MHKKEHKLKWTCNNREYRVAIYQRDQMGCPICEKRIPGGFKRYKHWNTCDDWRDRKPNRCWKSYRKHQYRVR